LLDSLLQEIYLIKLSQDDILARELCLYQGGLRYETLQDDGVDGERGEGYW